MFVYKTKQADHLAKNKDSRVLHIQPLKSFSGKLFLTTPAKYRLQSLKQT